MIHRHNTYLKSYKITKKDIERARQKKHEHNHTDFLDTIKDVKSVREDLYNSRKKIIEKNTSYIIQQKLQVRMLFEVKLT